MSAAARCQPTGDSHGVVCSVHGSEWMDAGRCSTVAVLLEVREERARQFARYGPNRENADGTGPAVAWLSPICRVPADIVEPLFRHDYEMRELEDGAPTWMALVREEVAEAFKEEDPLRLRAELLQVAALCVSWMEKLDERIWR
jgi:hypothetical protein